MCEYIYFFYNNTNNTCIDTNVNHETDPTRI